MKQLLFLIILLFDGTAIGNTIELPREKTEQVESRYEITAPCAESGKHARERLAHLFDALQLLFGEHLKPTGPMPDQMRVVIFRDKNEYVRELFPIESRIEMTNGLYFAPKKTMYLYAPETKVLFHEGTHQILREHFSPCQTPTFRNNFWVVEGIALFMETLRIEEEHYQLGNILADRLFSARIYQFDRDYDMPIRKLMAMGAAEVQSSEARQQIYSQSAALFHYLMFAEQGEYRKALFELLCRTYLGTATPETLSDLTGLSYEELDIKYLEFLETIPK